MDTNERVVEVTTSSARGILNPPLAEVIYLLFEDPNRWEYVAGGTVTSSVGGRRNTLIISPVESSQYYLQFDEDLAGMWILLPTEATLANLILSPTAIEDDRNVSVGLLCDETTAKSAVEYFVSTGLRSPMLNWIRDFDLPKDTIF